MLTSRVLAVKAVLPGIVIIACGRINKILIKAEEFGLRHPDCLVWVSIAGIFLHYPLRPIVEALAGHITALRR